MKKVAIVGTQGVPANYGGFETLVENLIGDNCSENIQYTVFCSSKDMNNQIKNYKGAQLKYVPFHANGKQSIPYDIISLIRSMRKYDVVLVLGVSGCMFLPVFRLFFKNKLIVNIDGLEHKRDKWGKVARWILRTSEAKAVKYADVVIADNKGIQDYVAETYNKHAELIAYGGDHVKRDISESREKDILSRYGLKTGEYSISICRIEPENNCQITLEAYSGINKKLVFVGNWQHSDYSKSLRQKYDGCKNIKFIDSLYDLDELNVLRSNAELYIHGHSAGGTNPSLVEAMFFGKPILCFDVIYNRESTQKQAYYWNNVDELKSLVSRTDLEGTKMKIIAESIYNWKNIARQYEDLY